MAFISVRHARRVYRRENMAALFVGEIELVSCRADKMAAARK